MNKIYRVCAVFEDFESTSFIDVGTFTDKNIAEDIKRKWEHFFKTSEDLFKEPDEWDPESDEWYDVDDFKKYGFDWRESFEYQKISSKYGYILKFKEIDIQEIIINKETFINNFKHQESLEKLMKEFNRDYNINKIIK